MKNISIDMGSSTTRIILNELKGNVLYSKEIFRFKTWKLQKDNRDAWDHVRIFDDILLGLSKINVKISSIAIDAWGVDYALLDSKKQIIGDILTYRDVSLNDIFDDFLKQIKIPIKKIYEETFLIPNNISTIVQIFRDNKYRKSILEKAKYLLNISDLFSFLLSGKIYNEDSIFSTSCLLNYKTSKILKLSNLAFLKKFENIKIINSPKVIGELKSSIASKLKLGKPKIIAISSHDTAAALSMIDIKKKEMFLGLGSWSVMGIINKKPLFNEKCVAYQIVNEKAAFGQYKILRNINGLYLLQKMLKELKIDNPKIGFANLINEVQKESAFSIAIDVSDAIFFNESGSIFDQIRTHLKLKNKKVPSNLGQYVNAIYNGLINEYQKTISYFQEVTGINFSKIHLFGGGLKDKYFISKICKTFQQEVSIGYVEATSIGNSLQQYYLMKGINREAFYKIKWKEIKNDK